jgi:hypothetical protein
MGSLNPRLLTRKAVTVEYLDTPSEVCGYVMIDPDERPNQIHHIKIFPQKCREIFQASQLYGLVPYKFFEMAILIHEFAHVMGDTFLYDYPLDNYISQYIRNVLTDAHDEYWLMMERPGYSSYPQLALSCIKWTTPPEISGTALENNLSTLFHMARFGVILPGADADFVSFCLPLVLSSLRGDTQNSIACGMAIYEYLQQKANKSGLQSQQDMKNANVYGQQSQQAVDIAAMQQLAASPQLIATANHDAVGDILSAKDGDQQQIQSLAKLAGTDGPPPLELDKNDAFYTDTLMQYGDLIANLRTMLTARKQKIYRVPGFDGELSPKKYTQAFLDSLIGEERRTQYLLKKSLLSMEVLVFGDVSWSTEDFQVLYARAKVVFLAALEDFPGVETGLINFNSFYSIVQRFGQELRKTRLYPEASGGTVLLPALQVAQKEYTWKAKDRFTLIITDGMIDSWPSCVALLREWELTQGIHPLLIELYDDDDTHPRRHHDIPGCTSSLRQLPGKLMEVLLQENW